MIQRKGRGLTFLCSLIPGAGEMYMGFMKQGSSIMALFCLLIVISGVLDFGPLVFILPVMWCYSFFHTHNLYSMPEEDFYAIEDDYIFHLSNLPEGIKKYQSKALAAVLIVLGLGILWSTGISYLEDTGLAFLPDGIANRIMEFLRDIPELVVAVVLIVVGIMMIKGRKKQLETEEKKNEE